MTNTNRRGTLVMTLDDLRDVLNIPKDLTVLTVEYDPAGQTLRIHVQGESMHEMAEYQEPRVYPIARCIGGECVYEGLVEPHMHAEGGNTHDEPH